MLRQRHQLCFLLCKEVCNLYALFVMLSLRIMLTYRPESHIVLVIIIEHRYGNKEIPSAVADLVLYVAFFMTSGRITEVRLETVLVRICCFSRLTT